LETFVFSITTALLTLAYALPKERDRDWLKSVLFCPNLLHGAKAIKIPIFNAQCLKSSVIASTQQNGGDSSIRQHMKCIANYSARYKLVKRCSMQMQKKRKGASSSLSLITCKKAWKVSRSKV